MPKLWSTDDLRLLDELWGQCSVQEIAVRLKRSPIAVQQKGYALHGSPLERNENVTISELGRCIGVAHGTVSGWIKQHHLPVHQRVLLRGRRYHLVDIDEFWRWAKHHQSVFSTLKWEPLSLGAEPEWMVAKRRSDALAKPTRWTSSELFELRRLLTTTHLTHAQIAARLGRTASGVRAKMRRIRLKEQAKHGTLQLTDPEDFDTRLEQIHGWLKRAKKRRSAYVERRVQSHVEWLVEHLETAKAEIERLKASVSSYQEGIDDK